MQLFICYSRADKQFAAQLVEDLADYDVRVWMDVRSIPHGTNWDLEVQKGLDSSDMMLVLLTPSAVASQNVADEWSYFIEKNKPIVPLLIQPCEVPFRLSRRQRVDFTTDYKTGFQQLIRAIGSPVLLDPESTQKIRPIPYSAPAPNPAPVQPAPQAAAVPSPVSVVPAARPQPRPSLPSLPDVGVRTLPVVWSDSYNWFNGMGANATQGDIMISSRELKLIPSAKPIMTIPLRSLVSARIQRSVDAHLKITYYGPDNSFQTLMLMGAPKERRKQINQEILNLLKLHTGRTLT